MWSPYETVKSSRRPLGRRVVRQRAWLSATLAGVYTLELSSEEVRLVRAALHAYLDDFGHDEAELLRALKALIARLPEPSERPELGGSAQSAVTEL